jgi:hypothetical protein
MSLILAFFESERNRSIWVFLTHAQQAITHSRRHLKTLLLNNDLPDFIMASQREFTTRRIAKMESYCRWALFTHLGRTYPPLDACTNLCSVDSKMDAHQKDAIRGALSSRISVIHGGAGTGKSSLVAAILKELAYRKQQTIVIAPTGIISFFLQ